METAKPLHMMNTTNWCITYWLTDGRTIDTLNGLTQNMPQEWSLEGQIEQGTDSEDKLHAQLFLKTPKTRGPKIAKYFPDCYINEARNPFALKKYVHKEETRVAEFKTIENRNPQWHVVRTKFFEWLLLNEVVPLHVKDDLDDRESPRLALWDKFCNETIAEGIFIELICVNPQYRSAIRRCWDGLVRQAYSTTSIGTQNIGTLEQNLNAVAPPLQLNTLAGGGGPMRQKSRIVLAP